MIKHGMFYHKAEVPAAVRPFPNWLLGASQGREVQHLARQMAGGYASFVMICHARPNRPVSSSATFCSHVAPTSFAHARKANMFALVAGDILKPAPPHP